MRSQTNQIYRWISKIEIAYISVNKFQFNGLSISVENGIAIHNLNYVCYPNDVRSTYICYTCMHADILYFY